jgi:uncharacterized protein (DUF2062 family)
MLRERYRGPREWARLAMKIEIHGILTGATRRPTRLGRIYVSSMGSSPASSLRFSAAAARNGTRFGPGFIADVVRAQFTQGITPEKIALSLAVGSVCAFFPILGAATPLCFLVGAALGLNQSIMQIINWGTAPLYLPLIYGFIRLGVRITGGVPRGLNSATILHHFGSLVGHALLGWAVLAPLWILGVYGICLPMLRAWVGSRRLAQSRTR